MNTQSHWVMYDDVIMTIRSLLHNTQNDHSDTEEESAYEKLQRKNIQEKEKKLADLGIASEVTNAKKPLKRKTKNIPSSSEPIRKSRRLATKR